MMSHAPARRRAMLPARAAVERSRQFGSRSENRKSSRDGATNPRCEGRILLGLIASAALALASACGSATAPVQGQAVIEECEPGEEPRSARCGWLTVFEDRERAAGRKINLRVVVYPALSRNPMPDPLFFGNYISECRSHLSEREFSCRNKQHLDRVTLERSRISSGIRT